MKKILMMALLAWCTGASATVVGFEDAPAHLRAIPDGYAGFNWNDAAEVDVFSQADVASGTAPAEYRKGVHSGTQAAFNVAGDSPAAIALAGQGSFYFNSAYFTASSGSETLSFVGLLGGNEVFTSGDFTIDDSGPQLLAPGYGAFAIDTLEIFSALPGSIDNAPPWILDDFDYSAGDGGSGSVPEPFSLSLMGLGLAALGATRRRKG